MGFPSRKLTETAAFCTNATKATVKTHRTQPLDVVIIKNVAIANSWWRFSMPKKMWKTRGGKQSEKRTDGVDGNPSKEMEHHHVHCTTAPLELKQKKLKRRAGEKRAPKDFWRMAKGNKGNGQGRDSRRESTSNWSVRGEIECNQAKWVKGKGLNTRGELLSQPIFSSLR